MKQKYILFLAFSLLFIKGTAQSNYAVTAIPYQPFTGSLTALPTNDDMNSGVINLPFNFDYYGVTYNQVLISTNGYIDFRTNLANTYSPFAFSQTIPNVAFPVKNAILGAYVDLNNYNGEGSVTYGVYGTAPNRKFVVYFDNNSLFSCTASKSTFQMILNETSNVIDVQLIDKQACATWNSGRTVTGLINLAGDMGIAAPGRNTGTWTAYHEAWRFYRPGYYSNYSFVRCDDDTDGLQVFDLSVASNDLGGNLLFYASQDDIQNNNPIANPTAFTNTTNPQTIYALGNGMVKPISLNVIDCSIDADNDTVATSDEDSNADTNLANDDTDYDGLPNYLDNDDDGDMILTNLEYVFGKNASVALDTDNDGIPNYLDNDDDGDGVATFLEDYNHDGNPGNDDTNTNGVADYLELNVALGVQPNAMVTNAINIYPNPATDVLNVQNNSNDTIAAIEIYTINGAKVKEHKGSESITTISVAELQTGVYFVKVTTNNGTSNYKFIKK
jgi:hypothetical protein